MRRPILLDSMAKGGGFCCKLTFLQNFNVDGRASLTLVDAELAAKKIGVSLQTVYRWNARIRSGFYKPCSICTMG